MKTTYALTLFTAVSLAAPVQQTQNDPVRRDGSGNFIGAGADGAMNEAVGELFKDLSPRGNGGEHRNLIDGIPIVGSLLGVCIYFPPRNGLSMLTRWSSEQEQAAA